MAAPMERREGCRAVTAAKNSGVEGEHEKRDDKAHAGQCDCMLDHVGSIELKFLMPSKSR